MNETILPATKEQWLELRAKDVTSTEVAALFGCSPYMTEFELWHRKREAKVLHLDENERMKWGNRLQDSIARGLAEDNGWQIAAMPEYVRDPELRMGASFDFSIERAEQHEGKGILECKNVDGIIFARGWEKSEDGNIEAPAHIELQVQQQLAVTGRGFAYIGALAGGNAGVAIYREPQADIIEEIRRRVKAFWASVDAGTPPAPDFGRDAEFITSLYNFANPGKTVDLRGEAELLALARRYRELGDVAKKAGEERDGIKAQILMRIGDAEKATGDGFTISAGLVGPAHVEYDREGYRSFRISWKKGAN